MERVGMFDAKTHFSELVDRVVREGKPITVTRRGVPVVEIVPYGAATRRYRNWEETMEELERLRAEVPRMTHQEIREAIEEGRH